MSDDQLIMKCYLVCGWQPGGPSSVLTCCVLLTWGTFLCLPNCVACVFHCVVRVCCLCVACLSSTQSYLWCFTWSSYTSVNTPFSLSNETIHLLIYIIIHTPTPALSLSKLMSTCFIISSNLDRVRLCTRTRLCISLCFVSHLLIALHRSFFLRFPNMYHPSLFCLIVHSFGSIQNVSIYRFRVYSIFK